MRSLVLDLRERSRRLRWAATSLAPEARGARQAPAAERVRTLLDPGSPFLEVGQLAAFGMYGGEFLRIDHTASAASPGANA